MKHFLWQELWGPSHTGSNRRVGDTLSDANFPLLQLSSISALWCKVERSTRPEKAFREQGERRESQGMEGLLGAWEGSLVTHN